MTSALFIFCFLFFLGSGYLKSKEQPHIDKKASQVKKKIQKLWDKRGWKSKEIQRAILQSAEEAYKIRNYQKDALEKFNKYSIILEYSEIWDVICKMMANAKFPDTLAKELMKLSAVVKKEENNKNGITMDGVYLNIIHELIISATEEIRAARLKWEFPKGFESVLMQWISIESDIETEDEFLAWIRKYTTFIQQIQKDSEIDFAAFIEAHHALESRLGFPKSVIAEIQKIVGEVSIETEDPVAIVNEWIDKYYDLVADFTNREQFKDAEILLHQTRALADEIKAPCVIRELNQIAGNLEFTKPTMNKRLYRWIETRFSLFQKYYEICQRCKTRFSRVKNFHRNHIIGDVKSEDQWTESVDVALISSAISTENFNEESFENAILDTTKNLTEEVYQIYQQHSNCNYLDDCYLLE